MTSSAPASPPPAADAARAPQPLRIHMILPAMPAGGMEAVVLMLCERLRRLGHELEVTCTEYVGAFGEELAARGVPVTLVRLPARHHTWHPGPLAAHLRARRPDVVHSHSGVWLRSARAAALAGLPPIVHTEHGILNGVLKPEPLRDRITKRLAARHTHRVVAVADALREHLVTITGIDARQVRLIPNGIDEEQFAPAPRDAAVRASLGVPAHVPLLGTVARLAPEKNHLLLIDAFARLRGTHPDAHLVVVGDGPMRDALETRVAELGIADAVRLPGVRRDTAALYRELDAFVLSSDSEGASISLLEAMATAVPCVATAVGGSPALLDHGACGHVVPPRDVDALALALGAALADRAAAADLGRRARARVAADFGAGAMVSAYEAE
ncbi:glycosyltransferase, partial [Roseisolibacter sp. H3M3-2]|uniref:glycosyltransferase n=1 Tax=Roseisolibacter sp. H3M3-2 TaxID=3031323 RepID=UPI0023DC7681